MTSRKKELLTEIALARIHRRDRRVSAPLINVAGPWCRLSSLSARKTGLWQRARPDGGAHPRPPKGE